MHTQHRHGNSLLTKKLRLLSPTQTRTQFPCSLYYYDFDGANKGNTTIIKIKKDCKLLWVRDCPLPGYFTLLFRKSSSSWAAIETMTFTISLKTSLIRMAVFRSSLHNQVSREIKSGKDSFLPLRMDFGGFQRKER